ncbi:MAG: DUF3352 domain-containing protein [Opitutales bacterium]|nr:DUF3352 domain-containing protein [Opitutales bacterium]
MKKSVTTALLLLASPVAMLAAPAIESLVSSDALFFAKVENMSDLVDKKDSDPLLELFSNESLQQMVIGDNEEAKELDSLNPLVDSEKSKELLRLFPTQWSFVVKKPQAMENSPVFGLIVEHNGDKSSVESFIKKALAESEEEESIESEVFEGTTIYTVTSVEEETTASDDEEYEEYDEYDDYSDYDDYEEESNGFAFAVADDFFVLSADADSVKSLISDLSGVDSSLPNSSAFRKMASKVSSKDAYMLVNLEAVAAYLEELIRIQLAPDGEDFNPMMPTADQIINALKLYNLEAFYAAFNSSSDESVLESALTYKNKSEGGILSLLAYETGVLSENSLVPGDSISASVAGLDLNKMISGIEQIISDAYPMGFMMYQQYLMNYNAQLGVDLKASLIGSIGNQMFTAALPYNGENGELTQVIGFSLKDSAAFSQALESIFQSMDLSEMVPAVDYKGATVYAFPEMGEGTGVKFAFAVSSEWLLISTGGDAPLHTALDQGNAGSSDFWKRREVAKAYRGLPKDSIGFSYLEVNDFIHSIIDSFRVQKKLIEEQNVEMAAMREEYADDPEMAALFEDQEGTFSSLNLDAVSKDTEFPYYLYSYSTMDEGALSSKAVFKRK